MSKEETELKEVEGFFQNCPGAPLAAEGSTRRSFSWNTVLLLNILCSLWTSKETFPIRQTGRGTVAKLGTMREYRTQRKVKLLKDPDCTGSLRDSELFEHPNAHHPP